MQRKPSTAVFTIIANNYSAHARVLLRSLKNVQPAWERFVLIVDTPTAESQIPTGLGRVVYPEKLKLPNPAWFAAQYSILEASTAVKPWMIEHLFNAAFDRVVYLDPDIKAYSPFEELESILGSAELVLTPHITQPYPDTATPNELDIRKSGIYNLGFVALRPTEHTRRLLKWWQSCCREDCRVAFDEHIFVDQSWMDFAPSFVPNTHILRHTGYNVAYWNLHYRSVDCSGYPAVAPRMQDGSNLRFFHFSGWNPAHPERLSKHQTRIADGAWPLWLQSLFKEYSVELDSEGCRSASKISWQFNPLADVKLPDALRRILLREPSIRGAFMRPLSPRQARSIAFEFLTQPDRVYPQLPVFVAEVYRSRKDLHGLISDRGPHFASKVLAWFEKNGRRELKLGSQLPEQGWWNGRRSRRRGPRGPSSRPRINFFGCFTDISDKAELARGCVRALRDRSVTLRPVNIGITAPVGHSPKDIKPDLPLREADIEIFLVQGSIRDFIDSNPSIMTSESYKIAYYDWHRLVPPAELEEIACIFDEIWCLSRQSRAVLRKKFTGPVRVLWPNLSRDARTATRITSHGSGFHKKCVFLALCDCAELPERSNTTGAVQAYLDAFPEEKDDHQLVIGVSNCCLRLDYLEDLKRLCTGRRDIQVTTEGSCWDQFRTFIASSTALICLSPESTLAEPARALALGKDLIALDRGRAAELCGRRPCRKVRGDKSASAKPDLKSAARAIKSTYKDWIRRRGVPRAVDQSSFGRECRQIHRAALQAALKRAGSRRLRNRRAKQLTAVIFGAGSAGEHLARTVGPLYRILAFADNDKTKSGRILEGHPIIAPDEIAGLAPDRILIASMYWKKIRTQLIHLGHPPEAISVVTLQI